jgi:hypothetical protein
MCVVVRSLLSAALLTASVTMLASGGVAVAQSAHGCSLDHPDGGLVTLGEVRTHTVAGGVVQDVTLPSVQGATPTAAAAIEVSLRAGTQAYLSSARPLAGATETVACLSTFSNGRFLSIVQIDTYDGGPSAAHPYEYLRGYVFDETSGSLLTTAQLFRTGISWAQVLANDTHSDIAHKCAPPITIGDVNQITALFSSVDFRETPAVTPGRDGVHVDYQPGTVGPESCGVISSVVPYGALADTLNPVLAPSSSGQPSPPPPPGPAPNPSPNRVVVLGDSYASGQGTYNNGSDTSVPAVDYYAPTASGSDHCHRSPAAYAPLLGVAAADFVACNGATTSDIIKGRPGEEPLPQLRILDHTVGTVILSAGGDDVGFANVLTNCTDVPLASAHSLADCMKAVNTAVGQVPSTMKDLAALYKTIEERTNNAHLVVVGYPDIFPPGGDSHCNWIDPIRQSVISAAGNILDDQIKATVKSIPHANFVEVRDLFKGHEVCGSTHGSYFNDLQTNALLAHNCPDNYLVPGAAVCSQSYHPNVPAYKAEADLIRGLLPQASAAPPATPGGPPKADCYDITMPGLDSAPAASYCASALNAAGFRASAHTNFTAADAINTTGQDAIFYAVGHTASECPGEWDKSSNPKLVDPNEATGAAILMPGPGGAGPGGAYSFLAGPRDTGQGTDDNCFPKAYSVNLATGWASAVGRAKLVVLQACMTLRRTYTSTDGKPLVSIGQQAYDAGAQVVLGFEGEVSFVGSYGQTGAAYGSSSAYRPGGDIWAHSFWMTMQSGATVELAAQEAQVEETNDSGAGLGYQTWAVAPRPGAAHSLAGMLKAGP